ncbi:LOW QUALITY PROTEIN: uncharacterized protein LOC108032951 [Drosophila biarmipes]|uniref:LOW QUALITY PROTEIN: uncharacterized protein LOC108032951 n=1 Tax=Drosophila biarmipes TaxID=125945 RepID=UPI0007E6A33C|nr:LOW QUALITY PROTEIN: uncharacterized protein LOC108032951 [Drosophila biarmipes]
MTANKQPLSAATNRQKLKTVGIPLRVRDAAKATPSSYIATNLVCPMWDVCTERKFRNIDGVAFKRLSKNYLMT